MASFLDYHSPPPPEPDGGARADIAALVMLLISVGFAALLACGGSAPSGFCALLPFSALGTTLGVVGVRERRGETFSVAAMLLNALMLPLSVYVLTGHVNRLSRESF